MLVKFTKQALKDYKKLPSIVQEAIKRYVTKLETFNDPRSVGKALSHDYKGCWRYRVGDYRLICKIQDKALIIEVIHIAHRKEVYKD